jgi:four helix bundle protein
MSRISRGQEAGDRGHEEEQETGNRRQNSGNRQQTTNTEQKGLMIMAVQSVKELEVYKKAYALAMDVFRVSRSFPAEEKYALTSQIRRSSRSVSMNLREAWAKRRYEAHFVSKLTDCDGECNETDTSLDFAKDCGYIADDQHKMLAEANREIGRMLGSMISNPAPFLLRADS